MYDLKHKFITYNAYIKERYLIAIDTPALKNCYQKAGGFKVFKANFVKCNSFHQYLRAISGSHLSAMQTYRLAKMNIDFGNRTIASIPSTLVSISREYDVEYPIVEGILSVKYWQERFGEKS